MNLAWQPDFFEPVVSLASATMLYVAYHYRLAAPIAGRVQRGPASRRPRMMEVLSHRLYGVLALGAAPLVVVAAVLRRPLGAYGLSTSASPLFYLAAGILCLLLFPVLLAYTRGSSDAVEPDPVQKEGTGFPRPVPGEVLLNAGSWVLYLGAYEFFMRGFLLFPLARSMGAWPAVAAMTCVYTAVHLHRPRAEAAGCVVMGPLFGVLTLWSGSMLPALIVHVFIANTTDLLALAGRRSGRSR